MKKTIFVFLKIFAVLALFSSFFSCNQTDEKKQEHTEKLVIASPHPFSLINPIIANFENEYNIDVTVVQKGTGEIIQNLLHYPDAPPYDVVWGGSYTSIRPYSAFFAEYKSKNELFMQKKYQNEEGMISRFSDIPSVLMINKNRLGSIIVNGYEDLLNPELKGLIAFANPDYSSSSWEHLLNMLYSMGNTNPEAGWQYVSSFCHNLDGKLLQSSSEVYDGVAKGKYAVGLTFEEGAANYAEYDENISIIYMNEGVLFTPDCVCIINSAENENNAKLFVDYVTGKSVQNYIARQLNRRPVRENIEIKPLFVSKEQIKCISIDYDFASKKKIAWLEHFRRILNPGSSSGFSGEL